MEGALCTSRKRALCVRMTLCMLNELCCICKTWPCAIGRDGSYHFLQCTTSRSLAFILNAAHQVGRVVGYTVYFRTYTLYLCNIASCGKSSYKIFCPQKYRQKCPLSMRNNLEIFNTPIYSITYKSSNQMRFETGCMKKRVELQQVPQMLLLVQKQCAEIVR